MITFFRQIRRKLANQNKFVQYSRYAVGEIILVMVGILLALQVNNWNETRKRKQTEIKLLTEIRNDLVETLYEVKRDLRNHSFSLSASDRFREILLTNTMSDSIGYYFVMSRRDYQAYPKTSGFKLLESKGMDVISNDSLRKGITDIYELGIKRLVEMGKLHPFNDISKVLLPYEKKHFVLTNEVFLSKKLPEKKDSIRFYRYEPVSLIALKNDYNFQIEFQNTMMQRLGKIEGHQIAIQKMEKVINDIFDELAIIR